MFATGSPCRLRAITALELYEDDKFTRAVGVSKITPRTRLRVIAIRSYSTGLMNKGTPLGIAVSMQLDGVTRYAITDTRYCEPIIDHNGVLKI